MPQDITTIPLSELKKDLYESDQDIIVCELALMQGTTTYGDGESTQRRQDINKAVSKMIRAELERREQLEAAKEVAKKVVVEALKEATDG